MENALEKLLTDYCPEMSVREQNPLEKLLLVEGSEIMINSWNHVYVEEGGKIQRIENVYSSKDNYEKDLYYFLAKYNQRIAIDKPILDFDIENRFRVCVVHSNITQAEPVLSIRKKAEKQFTRERFLQNGFFTEEIATFLEQAVRDRKTIFISGETSSGKTTLLNYLLTFIDPEERLIVIEDTQEIKAPKGSNAIYMRTAEAQYEVKPTTSSDLVKASLRLRPDRIILGEIRRDEIIDYLHAINTGHNGALSTGHGSSAKDMLARLEILLLEANVPYEAVGKYLGGSIDLIVQMSGKKHRKVQTISSIHYVNGKVEIHDLVENH
ncbi:CpaF family protein [Guggenheimella bovis]